MTKDFPPVESSSSRETYVDPAEIMRVLGELLCTHPEVTEGDRLQIFFPLSESQGAVVDSYFTYITLAAEERPDSLGSETHREFLSQETGLVRASIRREGETQQYQVAKPSALSPGLAESHFEAFLGCSTKEISMAVAGLARASNYARPITAYQLCEQLGKPYHIPLLDTPYVFLNNGEGYEILRPASEHLEHHQNLRQLLDAAIALPQ